MNQEWDMSCEQALVASAAVVAWVIGVGVTVYAISESSFSAGPRALIIVGISLALTTMALSPLLSRPFERRHVWGWPPSPRARRQCVVWGEILACCLLATSVWAIFSKVPSGHDFFSLPAVSAEFSLTTMVVMYTEFLLWLPLMSSSQLVQEANVEPRQPERAYE